MLKEYADLVIRNVKVYNSYFKKFDMKNVYIVDGKFLYIGKDYDNVLKPKKIIEGKERYLVPGLIDIHMHIESSMVSPKGFSDFIAGCGVTTIVSEPHEMANVAGIDGIYEMINAGKDSKIDIFYGIPSSVPASSEELETTGGKIDYEDMKKLKKNPFVACVGEVMNYRQVIKPNNLEITKFIEDLRKTDKIFPIEGHCPALVDLDLAKFLYLGINADHTEHSLEELHQRFENGMFVEIQEKMLHKEVMDYIIDNNLYEYFAFVTDDVMTDTLYEYGQLDHLVRKAIKLGFTPEQAIYNATYTPARRMNLFDRGVIAPGKLADFVLLDNLEEFTVSSTYKNGRLIYDKNITDSEDNKKYFSKPYYNSIKIKKQEKDVLKIKVQENVEKVLVNVMELKDKSTRTSRKQIEMPVENNILKWEDSGCLLAAVFERYGKNNNIGIGFLTGDCHKEGAVASSYAHDNHNILVAGSNVEDMILALNRLIEMQGGMVVTNKGEIQADLQLNVGGILSEEPIAKVANKLSGIRGKMIEQGYNHYNPIMSFGTLTLTVSPELKITDKGLIDVVNSKIMPLYEIL
ncbi:adenine deaminase C-terminal domain-containing protein [Miniphocaeibacter halophilus]|uniref:Adenine deaminase n=1 Tax=Miniphocaeibacter halophilus TaxID=2931922 RepID=A0AC61MTI6_9FIRM|nr:adenine deaminase C-terminal domain-containing protein [Miniphocaeibacter halophilus]QQK08129.1 adenine deaminase [Miniphocaeibacter halophilus]